jgi:hypothetical protein
MARQEHNERLEAILNALEEIKNEDTKILVTSILLLSQLIHDLHKVTLRIENTLNEINSRG